MEILKNNLTDFKGTSVVNNGYKQLKAFERCAEFKRLLRNSSSRFLLYS